MKLSIVIPACNEEKTLEKVVKEIKKVLQKENICNEIIIIDDNSVDQTGNIADWKLLLQHLLFIPARLVVSLLKGKITSLIGFIYALKHLKEVIRKRRSEKQFARINDNEIFNLFKE